MGRSIQINLYILCTLGFTICLILALLVVTKVLRVFNSFYGSGLGLFRVYVSKFSITFLCFCEPWES